MRTTAVLLAAMLGAVSVRADWKSSHGNVAETGNAGAIALSPPFSQTWAHQSGAPLRGSALLAAHRAFFVSREFHVEAVDAESGAPVWSSSEGESLVDAISLDGRTGRVRWRREMESEVVHSHQAGNGVMYVATAAGGLHALAEGDGSERWRVDLTPPLSLPAADETLVVTGSAGDVVGIGATSALVIFRTAVGEAIAFNPVVAPEAVYVTEPHAVIALGRTGGVLWRVPAEPGITSALALADAGLLAGLADGTVQLLARDRNLLDRARHFAGLPRVIWSHRIVGVPTVLSAVGDLVYVGNGGGRLICLDLATGAAKWVVQAARDPVEGIALADGRMVVSAASSADCLVPAPLPPEHLVVGEAPGGVTFHWDPVAPNGSAVMEYVVWRRAAGGPWIRTGSVATPGVSTVLQIPGGAGEFSVTAVALNGGVSDYSTPVSLQQHEPLLSRLVVTPMPDAPVVHSPAPPLPARTPPRRTPPPAAPRAPPPVRTPPAAPVRPVPPVTPAAEPLAAPSAPPPAASPEPEAPVPPPEPLLSRFRVAPQPYLVGRGMVQARFELREPARVIWDVIDVEGRTMIDERTMFLPRGPTGVTWDGLDRFNSPVYPGTYLVRVRAVLPQEEGRAVAGLPVIWGAGGSGPVLSGGVPGGPRPGSGSAPQGSGAGATDASSGHGNNGVRDHGIGEGRDGAGQGRGQGSDHGRK